MEQGEGTNEEAQDSWDPDLVDPALRDYTIAQPGLATEEDVADMWDPDALDRDRVVDQATLDEAERNTAQELGLGPASFTIPE